MPVSDPIADMLTRVRNAQGIKHESLSMPGSKAKIAIAEILKGEGFIRDFEVIKTNPQYSIRIHLSYRNNKTAAIGGLKKISKPGLRVYVGKSEIPRVYGGLGISIISTSKGLMTGQQARREGLGGELLCYVW